MNRSHATSYKNNHEKLEYGHVDAYIEDDRVREYL